ncbi:MAG: signal transduction histidine kinase/DNA-binding response OmpR family regulator, partial [Alteromonadaceae bacterium]
YVFQLRASNSHGSYNDRYRTINITITPPVWRTWQAYLLYFILLIGGTFSLYRYRTQALIKQAAQLEQIVRDRTARINSLMAQKEQMFANLSHEFKTPLTLIITPLASLLTSLEKVIPSELASEVSRKKSMMLRNGQRLLRMIDQLLELSDLQSDIDQSQVEYSLKETLELLLVAFEPLLNSKQQRLHCKPFDDVTVTLKTDALETILTNLISNAIKYTPNNGRINIAIHSTISVLNVSQVEISIIDTGIGISPQDQDIVFNRFTRADAKRNKNIPGAGIGLALVKELISSHQGSIELTSEVGEGSTFTVTLPISAKTAKQNQSAIESTTSISHTSKIEIESLLASTTDFVPIVDMPLSDQGKTTLLLIDDNAEMLELLVDTLQHKYYCLSALNGEEGLALARQQLPDLIISDVMMPGIDGFEVVKQLKQLELTCHIPVILLTAKGDLSSRLKGWSEKADEYLQKPFNETELLVRVDNLLSIRRLLHQRYQKAFLQSQDEQPHNQTNPAELIEPSEPLAPSEPIEPVKTTPLHQHFFNQLNAILAKHYSNEDFNVATLGSEMNLSNRQLSRKMKAILDLTPVESIRGFRLKRAAELLTNGATASTVAYEVGFTSHSYFSKCFKAQFDCSPSQFSQKEC